MSTNKLLHAFTISTNTRDLLTQYLNSYTILHSRGMDSPPAALILGRAACPIPSCVTCLNVIMELMFHRMSS